MQYIDLLSDLGYGAAIGAALGLTGTGGSILTVPALVYLVGEDMHTAIGTSLAIVGGIAIEGAYQQRENVQWQSGLLLGVCGLAGSVPGSLLSPYFSSATLLLLFSAIMIVASISMLRSGSSNVRREANAPLWVIFLTGGGIGFLTGFIGVGGGFLIVPAMVFAFGCTMQVAIATSLLVIAFNSFFGLATRFATASVEWTVVAAFVAGGLGANIVASKLVRRLDQRRLKRIFAVFILVVGLFIAASATGIVSIRVK